MIIERKNSTVKNIFINEINNVYDFIESSIVNNEIKMQNFIKFNNFVHRSSLNQKMHFADNICDAFNRFKCF